MTMTDKTVTVSSEHIRELSARMIGVIQTAQRADNALSKKKSGIQQALFDIALDCTSRAEFNAASRDAEHDYKAESKVTKLPPTFVQARSDIKTMYDEDVNFRTEAGEVVSFATAFAELRAKRKAARNVAKRTAAAKAEAKEQAVLAAMSEEQKTFLMIVETVNQIGDRGLWNDLNGICQETLQEYLATHPEALQKRLDTSSDVSEEDEETAQAA